MPRKTIYEWAVEYCGDPASHVTRGSEIVSYMIELGLQPHDKVLDVGCGALSQGAPLIRYLAGNQYTGLDPNGWLIETALDQNRDLEHKNPRWSYNSDFLTDGGPFDWVVAHSVLSHVAYWQLEQALSHIRSIVPEGGRFLASIRLDQYDSFSEHWVYPGNSFFRFQTVQSLAYYFGWHTEMRHDFRERLSEICPNDVHDWLLFTAVPSSAELNERRLEIEEQRRKAQALEAKQRAIFEANEQERLKAIEAEQQDTE